MAAGLSHRQAVLVLYGFCVVLGGAALILTYASSGQSALLLVVLALVAFVFLRSLGYMRLDRVSRASADRKRNRALRAAVRPIGRRLQQVRRDRRDLAHHRRGGGRLRRERDEPARGEATTSTRPPSSADEERRPIGAVPGQFVVPGGKAPSNARWK